MDVGAVADLRNVKEAIRVSYAVMKYTEQTLLVGEQGLEMLIDQIHKIFFLDRCVIEKI